MTRTVLESKSKTVVMGFDEPFCVIGERINPTGRKKLAAELEAGDFSTVEKDALEQVACGAMVLDVNAGVVYNSNPNPNETEPPLMRRMIELVQGLVDVPLCIDSSVPGALEAGLAAAEGRPLLNSVTGEEDRLELVLPLVKKYNVPVVAISNDDTGISEDPDVRFAVAKKIVERAADFGIPAHDIVVDPLVMPVGAMATAGQQVFTLVRKLREELGVAMFLWLVLVVMITDILGYFAGRLIGGPKFWPRVSPKKTWSGTVAGWVGAAIVGWAFMALTGVGAELVAISVALSIASQMGDVGESALKRHMGVKDSSNLLPGHGGVYDRFDGLLGAAFVLVIVESVTAFPPPPL